MLRSWNKSSRHRSQGRWRGWWENAIARFGSVTHLIVWTCVVVFLAQLIAEFVRWPVVDSLFALSGAGIRQGFIWQPLTYMFLHGGIWHILINLFILWFMGREVEYFIGPTAYTRLYLLGGVVGGLLWLGFNYQSPIPVVGASAAVLACVVAFATLFPNRELTFLIWFIIPVTIKAKYLALIFVALDLVPLLQRSDTGVAHLAHLGGAALGWFYIKHLGYGRRPRWLEAIESAGQALKPRPRVRRAAADEAPPRRRRVTQSPEDYIREQVDPILDKISRDGIHSLTDEERRILESAKELLKKRSG